MPAHLRKFLTHLGESFWLVPAALTLLGIFAAVALVRFDRADALPAWLIDGEWVYNGGGTGARTLLGAVASSTPPPSSFWKDATPVVDLRRGYLQELDADGLADWAAENGTSVQLLVRPGDYVFPGTPSALVLKPITDGGAAIRRAMALGATRISSIDLEFAVRQLVEVAVRALSRSINDPHTAIGVLDRLGASLCDVAPVFLPSGVHLRAGRPALVTPSIDYAGLCDTMFHMIRQNAAGNAAVLIRILEVLAAVASCERQSDRIVELERHTNLVLSDAVRSIGSPADLAGVRRRQAAFVRVLHGESAA